MLKRNSAVSANSQRSSSPSLSGRRKSFPKAKTRSSSSDSDSNKRTSSFLSSSGSISSNSRSPSSSRLSDSRRSLLKNHSRESVRSKSPLDKRSSSSSSSSRSSSSESAKSSRSNLSKANSLKNLEAEYEPIATNLPFNVYQTLFSIKSSNLKIYTLNKEFQENRKKIKRSVEEQPALVEENKKLANQMLTESCGAISLIEVIYGNIHWKLAKERTNLALLYLDIKSLPKQAKLECEKAWSILVEDFRHKTRMEMFEESSLGDGDDDGLHKSHVYPDCNKHQMILNYIYGRASTLLKENDDGQAALESADEYCSLWCRELKSSKERYAKYKSELNNWRQKIFYALAKQYAINRSDKRAMESYDKCLAVLIRKKAKTESFAEHETMVKIYKDKSKLELEKDDRESFLKDIEFSKASIQVAEESGSLVLIGDAKLSLAKLFAQKDDQNSADKAEELFKEVVGLFAKASDTTNEHTIKAKDELVKFYLKMQRYEDAIGILNELVKEKSDLFGDFSLKLGSSYKLLCSIYLVKNDMPTAARNLQKSLEIEEINYGSKDKRYQETKEMFENLKKNPNVKVGENEPKPVFHVKKKIDYSKSDQKLFSPVTDPATGSVPSEGAKSSREESFVNSKIAPIK